MSLRQFEYFFVEKFLLNSDFDRLPGNSKQPAAASDGGSAAAAVAGGGAAAEDEGQPAADGAAAEGSGAAAEDSGGAAAEDSVAAEKALVEKLDNCAQEKFENYDYGAFLWQHISVTNWMSQPHSIQHSTQQSAGQTVREIDRNLLIV